MYELAECYLKGLNGVEQSPEKSLGLLERSAAQDYAPAFSRLGEFYIGGKCGVKQDGYRALEYFLKATELDEDEDNFETIADIYLYGEGGVKPDGNKAVEYLLKGWEINNNDFFDYQMEEIYLYGHGEIKPDARKAFEFCYEHDLWTATYNCCSFDDENGGVKYDGLKTLDCCKRRVERLKQLNAPPIITANELNDIAAIYEEGYGELAPNRQKAIEYYEQILAIYGGKGNLRFKRKIAELTGTGIE